MKVDRTIAEAAEIYDSFYLYSEAGILAQSEKLKTAFPGVSFLYSVKCNPNRHILRSVFDNGFGADAASAGEVRLPDRPDWEKSTFIIPRREKHRQILRRPSTRRS